MKKTQLFIFVLLLSSQIIFIKCVDEHVISNDPKPGVIYLDSQPQGAKIYIEGTYASKTTPDSLIDLDKGTYSLTLTKNGYYDTTFSVEVFYDLKLNVFTELKEVPDVGSLTINSTPTGASIKKDGLNTGENTPHTFNDIPIGNHTIILQFPDYYDTTFVVNVLPDQTITKNVSMIFIPKLGNLSIRSVPDSCEIFIDGNKYSKSTPTTINGLEIGDYTIKLTKPYFFDSTFTASVSLNTTTDYLITMNENLPEVDYSIRYTVNQSTGQISFFFLFNQDVRYDRIEVLRPFDTQPINFSYNSQLLIEGTEIQINFPTAISGEWKFTIYGNKANGNGGNFVISKTNSI